MPNAWQPCMNLRHNRHQVDDEFPASGSAGAAEEITIDALSVYGDVGVFSGRTRVELASRRAILN